MRSRQFATVRLATKQRTITLMLSARLWNALKDGGCGTALTLKVRSDRRGTFYYKWEKNGTAFLNVVFGFHCAAVTYKIIQQGFNKSFCGKNATVYGKGVYFARDAAYSADPAYSGLDDNGLQYMMACRVVVGEYCRGQHDALTPDVRDPKTHSLYDSTVGLLRNDTMMEPSIYVTYHGEFVLKLKVVPVGSHVARWLTTRNHRVLLLPFTPNSQMQMRKHTLST
jgi:hypothetical protein